MKTIKNTAMVLYMISIIIYVISFMTHDIKISYVAGFSLLPASILIIIWSCINNRKNN